MNPLERAEALRTLLAEKDLATFVRMAWRVLEPKTPLLWNWHHDAICEHLGGVSFRQIQGTTLWELNAGFAGDPESKGLSYTPQKITQWTLGFAAIDSFGPRFIPYR